MHHAGIENGIKYQGSILGNGFIEIMQCII
jgi:hypothetical protein